MNTERAFAVVTGGGTSGHVLPALAIADALVAGGHERASIHYVGTLRGVETTLLPPTGYPHTFLDVVGLQRSVSARNLAFLPKLFGAVRAARALLQELQPKVVADGKPTNGTSNRDKILPLLRFASTNDEAS